jgi:hypothetical protein
MNFFIKSTAIALAIVSLTACSDNDNDNDNDNSELTSVIQLQNDILAQQKDTNTTQNDGALLEASVTVTGNVKNISTDNSAKNGSIIIKVGNVWSEPVKFDDEGNFVINELPFNSDYTLIVQSNEDSFLNRTYYGTTRDGSSGIIYQDIGTLSVSEGELKSLSFVDSITNESITGLKLYSYSYVVKSERAGVIGAFEEYTHESSYNEVTAEYEIILPKDISVNLYGSLDLNNDSEVDYALENSYYSPGSQILLRAEALNDTNTIYLVDQTKLIQNIELRIAVLDQNSNNLKEVTLSIDDENGKVSSVYDDSTGQHLLNSKLKDSVSVYLPAFNINDDRFESSTISIRKYDENRIRITTLTYQNNGHSTNTYYVPIQSTSLDIVIQPRLITSEDTQLELVTKTVNLDENNTTFKAFYSQAIELTENSIELIQKNIFSIARGNEAEDDLILPGSTLLSLSDKAININTELSLNNTLLTATPESSLQSGFEYQYIINEVLNSNSKDLLNIFDDDSAIFSIQDQADATFDINSLKLDNNNYYTNGALIKTTNSAGEASSVYYNSRRVRLLIPQDSLKALKSLTLRKRVVTNDNLATNEDRSWQVVSDGQINHSQNYLVSVAENENLIFENINSYSVLMGTASPDGRVYTIDTYEYLQDNTDSLQNSITFSYTFQTHSDEISTGEITLKVQ